MPLRRAAPSPSQSLATGRPMVMGSRYMISSGHYLASVAGLRMLERAGNAVDAGVAAGLAINVVQPDMTSLGGVAPIMIYLARTDEVVTISGVGWWPKAATLDAVKRLGHGGIGVGVGRTVVPAAVDAWLTALSRYGTLRLADVAAPAIQLAEHGFAMYRAMRDDLALMDHQWFDQLPTCRAHFAPHGRLPEVGARFLQPALARTLKRLVEAETQAQARGRAAGIAAARDRFYRGDVADGIARFYQEAGGLLTRQDLAEFAVEIEPPVKTSYRGYDVYACGPWSQGPVVPETLNILEGFENLGSLRHNSPEALHLIVESLKLAFSDRHSFYGDPRFVDVPIQGLLSKAFAAERRALIDRLRAWPTMPPPGEPAQFQPSAARSVPVSATGVSGAQEPDTSYVCVVDADGNGFSATPSDAPSTPIVPELGLAVSSRGYQAWVDPEHPASVAPGKRPRLTPSPGMVLKDGHLLMPFGTPGNDRQPQAMVQFLVNLIDFGLDVQAAVEAPRVASYSFPATGHPHPYDPGLVRVEAALPSAVRAELEKRGHRVESTEDHSFEGFGSVCAVLADRQRGVLYGAADPRRVAYAVGW